MKPSIGARFDGLSDVERKVVKALWQFRPGARLPFPLVELAVEVETGESRYIAFGNIVSAGFLKLVVQHDGFKQFMFYELPQEVSTWLTEQGLARKWEGLFQGPQLGTASNVQPANLPRPAGSTLGEIKTEPLQEGRGAAAAAASAEQGLKEKQYLLAAFLAAYGNDQGSVNVPQEAERFLNEELGLGVRNWAKPDLSQHPHARKLTYWIEEGLRAETVVSAVLASSGADFMGIPELKQGPRQLFDIFISNNRAGETQSCGLGWPSFRFAQSVTTSALLLACMAQECISSLPQLFKLPRDKLAQELMCPSLHGSQLVLVHACVSNHQ